VHPSVEGTVRLVQDLKNRLRRFDINDDDDNPNYSTVLINDERSFCSGNSSDKCAGVDTSESIGNCVPAAQSDAPTVSTSITQPSPPPLPRLPKRLSTTGANTRWSAVGILSRAKRYRPPPPVPSSQSVAEAITDAGSTARRASSPAIFSAPIARSV